MRSMIRSVGSSILGSFVMASIWDIPPPPQFGDDSEDITFTSVGRALSRWEEFEAVFASLFAALVGTEDNNAAALRAYGSIITFRGRAGMVRAAAEIHFAMFPDLDLEKKFRAFVNELTNHASARRNEIAHGVVRVSPLVGPDGLKQYFFLYPPRYASNKNELKRIDSADSQQIGWYEPQYIYSSVEIDQFAAAFRGLVPRLVEIMGPMLERRAPKVPKPPA
jgi:hypothetical protein